GGGGGRGSKMQNSREKRGSKRSEAVILMRVLVGIVRVWVSLGSFSSNRCSKAVQNDHLSAEPIGKNPKKSAEPREPGGISRRQSPVTTQGFAPRMVEESRREPIAPSRNGDTITRPRQEGIEPAFRCRLP